MSLLPCSANAIATPQYHHIEEAATEQLKVASADAQVSLLEMITNLSLRGQRLLQSVLPLLVSKDACVRRSSFAAIHQLVGVSSKAGLERLMADMGILDIAVRDEVCQPCTPEEHHAPFICVHKQHLGH